MKTGRRMRVQFRKTGSIKKRGREFQYSEEEKEEAERYRILLPFNWELDTGDIKHYLAHENEPGVEHIEISGKFGPELDFSLLVEVENLCELTLRPAYSPNYESLPSLESFKSLKDHLVEFRIMYEDECSQKIDLGGIEYLSKLTYLNLDWNENPPYRDYSFDPDLTPVSKLQNLEEITLWGHFNDLDLSPLSGCASLKDINLGNSRPYRSINFPTNESLEYIGFHRTSLTDDDIQFDLDLEPLRNCTSLKSLHIRPLNVKCIDVTPLLGHPSLQELDLGPIEKWDTLNVVADASRLEDMAKISWGPWGHNGGETGRQRVEIHSI
ncbi:MAG: hypothetical protein ACFFE2_12545 [Candidatus Thorarchaeota archaeon]